MSISKYVSRLDRVQVTKLQIPQSSKFYKSSPSALYAPVFNSRLDINISLSRFRQNNQTLELRYAISVAKIGWVNVVNIVEFLPRQEIF